jgi:hypothetical protein
VPKLIKPDVRELAKQLLAQGISNNEVARRLDISEGSVRLIKKTMRLDAAPAERAAPEPPPRPAPVRAPVSEPDPEVPLPARDTLDSLRRLLDKTVKLAEQAERDGNTTAAQRAYRDAVQAMNTLARLDREKSKDTDSIVLPKAEVERALTSVRERVQLLANVPLTCCECGRRLRLAATKGE